MCLAIPGKVVEIKDNDVTIAYGDERRQAKLINMEIKVGDFVVVQNRMVLQKVPEDQAIEAQKLWEQVLANES